MWRHQCKLDDSGPTLEAFDLPRLAFAQISAAPPCYARDSGADDLRRLSHKLRPLGVGAAERREAAPLAAAPARLAAGRDGEFSVAPAWDGGGPAAPAWGVTLLLAAGLAMLLGGVASLAWSMRHVDAQAAHWGLTAGLAGVGLLTVAIARMTARMWRQNRRLAAKLDSMSEQLESMRGIAATTALVRAAGR